MLLHLARKSLAIPLISISRLSINNFHSLESPDIQLQSMPLLATASEAVGLLHGARPDVPDWFVWTTIFIISYFAQQSLLRFLAKL